jgi:hypothetical protein
LALRLDHFIHIGISRRVDRAALGARIARKPVIERQLGAVRNIGRTWTDFQYSLQSINGLLRTGLQGAGDSEPAQAKGRHEAGLRDPILALRSGEGQSIAMTWLPQLK